jgi:hypothetical protein
LAFVLGVGRGRYENPLSFGAGGMGAVMPIEKNRLGFSSRCEGRGQDWHSVSHHKSSSVGIAAPDQRFIGVDFTP